MNLRLLLVALMLGCVFVAPSALMAAGGGGGDLSEYAYPEHNQKAKFPTPLLEYEDEQDLSMLEIIGKRAQADWFNIVATLIFILAIVHTFLAGWFNKMAHDAEVAHRDKIEKEMRRAQDKDYEDAVDDVSPKATFLHFLGEVEAVFGIWVIVLGVVASFKFGFGEFVNYVNTDRNYVEPMFVVVIMAISASRPVVRFAERVLAGVASLGKGSPTAWWWSIMTIAPVLGSFITEPAAMTIAALLLGKKYYRFNPKPSFAYATLGLLFVNISVGGTLTYFAAPPVLMVASTWDFNVPFLFMFEHFGYKALIGIVIANALYFAIFRKELVRMADAADGKEDGVMHPKSWREREDSIPLWVTLVHLMFLGWTVFVAHDPVLFIGGFLFFMAFVTATQHHQNAIQLKTPVLVGFFLGSLIIHGGLQGWWIEPILTSLGEYQLMAGATILTAFNDNAAITFLASEVPNLADGLKYAVVAGAVVGGGLTVIANAPNPAGQSLLRRYFDGGISPGGLLKGALVPTLIMFACFAVLPSLGNGREGVDNPLGGGDAIHEITEMDEDGDEMHMGDHAEGADHAAEHHGEELHDGEEPAH